MLFPKTILAPLVGDYASANGTSKDSFFRYTDGNFEEIGIGMEKTLFVGEVNIM